MTLAAQSGERPIFGPKSPSRPSSRLTAGFFEGTSHITALAGLGMFPEVMIGVGAAVLFIVMLASVVSARRVLLLEPAVVFRG